MDIISQIKNTLYSYIESNYSFDINSLSHLDTSLNVDVSKQQFGDITTNVALLISKQLKRDPKSIAQDIKNNFKNKHIDHIDIAGPGFINIFLTLDTIKELAHDMFIKDQDFFKSKSIHENYLETELDFSLEFVSANPTGPLHIGHGRGGIIGDVLSNILKFLSNKVTKEFYINDAGNQIEKLGQSFKIRCLQQVGVQIELPDDAYHGEYLIDLAKKCVKEYNLKTQEDIESKDLAFFSIYAKDFLLNKIEKTLEQYGINYDVWFSEKTLHHDNSIELSIEKLEKQNYIYKKDEALWFKSTAFGDDKDRVVKKSSGEYTYVAADIAYLENKIARGASKIIMILGQDHHSYVNRLKGLMEALGYNPDDLTVILYQLVTIKQSGETLRLSKRAGRIVTLEDVINLVGSDVARFFYLNKKADAHLDFDLDLALKQTDENPVYYVQYAYVRTISILNKAQEELKTCNENAISFDDYKFLSESERFLIKKIAYLKDLLESISTNYQVHLLTYYVLELAQLFHSYYGSNKVINKDNIEQTRGRLFFIMLLKRTLNTCFKLLGISAPEHM
ncbi:arginine--tRNA ligase [Candidatus Babela massiliensis]|uniref:Arginine--tRNA ligase n=1 Tax=Candidatus Babela massiliensis TaxID=673862 RepID=V6DHH9_9BACT|nr:arginine--tRNA ligase [Candidatus Babela massiliensis]CDK31005.1 Arginyl-tRNA synthetase [Candidatus Babela massiliensis]